MKTKAYRGWVTGVLVLAAVGLSCSTKERIDKAIDKASKLLDEYAKLGKTLNDTITEAKNAAKTAVSGVKIGNQAQVPALPPKVTGNVNVSKAADGKSGTFQHDMDGDGASEQVQVFQQEDGGPLYESWAGGEGKADDGWQDAGLCYLLWTGGSGPAWLMVAECGANDGAWICTIEGDAASCSACNVEGNCSACNEESDEPCAWPAPGQPPADGGQPEVDGGVAFGCEQMCTDLVQCELIEATVDECAAACDPEEDTQTLSCVEEAADCAAVAACLPD